MYLEPAAREELKKELLKNTRVTNYELLFKRKDGKILVADCNVRLVENVKDETIEIEGFFRDRTLQKRSEDALRDSERRLALTLEATSSGTWDWNIQTGEVLLGSSGVNL